MRKVSMNWKNGRIDIIARRRLVEDQNTFLELSGRIQELKNEINCMNDSRDFQDAESVRSGHSTLPVNLCFSHLIQFWNAKPFYRNAEPGPPSIWDTDDISGNVFANPTASSSAPFPQELNPWSSHISEQIHSSTAEKNENQTPAQDQRCQSGPQPKNQSSLVREILQRIMGQTNNDCRFQIFISTNSPLHFCSSASLR